MNIRCKMGLHQKPYELVVANAEEKGGEFVTNKQVTIFRCPRCGAPVRVCVHEYRKNGDIVSWQWGDGDVG